MPVSTQPLVLVADDEQRITKLVSMALTDEGFRVVTAGGGEEALAKAEEVRPDIVLLDIVMPDLDGIEVMRQIPCQFAKSDIDAYSRSSSLTTARRRPKGALHRRCRDARLAPIRRLAGRTPIAVQRQPDGDHAGQIQTEVRRT